ncbi:MAG: 2-oxoacid ferredoxin oxidoreductase [Nitrospinota bacterium]|nr:MAG: 2-oxoacid ferredoxin oxidoreductase [Nitrospinota bacterium]
MSTVVELPVSAYKGPVDPDWCPGCGDFGVLRGLQKAASKLGIHPSDLMVVSGIGCSSNLPGFIHAYGFHGLHGRAVPLASGMKFGNHDLHVIVTGGDGDGYGIGIGHFIHAMRRNLDITYIVMNNMIYGLTTGQASPTTEKGKPTKSTPLGNLEEAVNPLALALVCGATFVARGFSGQVEHLSDLFAQGIQHKGFSLIDVFSPCVTYMNTYAFFKQHCYLLEETDYQPTDFHQALDKALEWGDKVPIGVFYRTVRPTYDQEEPALQSGPLFKQPLGISPEEGQRLLADFM